MKNHFLDSSKKPRTSNFLFSWVAILPLLGVLGILLQSDNDSNSLKSEVALEFGFDGTCNHWPRPFNRPRPPRIPGHATPCTVEDLGHQGYLVEPFWDENVYRVSGGLNKKPSSAGKIIITAGVDNPEFRHEFPNLDATIFIATSWRGPAKMTNRLEIPIDAGDDQWKMPINLDVGTLFPNPQKDFALVVGLEWQPDNSNDKNLLTSITFHFQDNKEDVPRFEVTPAEVNPFEEGLEYEFTLNLTSRPKSKFDATIYQGFRVDSASPDFKFFDENGLEISTLTIDRKNNRNEPHSWKRKQKFKVKHVNPDYDSNSYEGWEFSFLIEDETDPNKSGVLNSVQVPLIFKNRVPPTVHLSASPNPVVEGNVVHLYAHTSNLPVGNLEIPVIFTAGTAEPSDYGGKTTGILTVPNGGNIGHLIVPTFEDDDGFDDETFTVAIDEANLPDPYVTTDANPKEIEIVIKDNDTRFVNLKVSPNPVDEGSSVTVTAELSRVLRRTEDIPIILTPGTAESGDYGNLGSIRILQGQLRGRGEITTTQDTDVDDETFTVGLGTLPADVVAGNSASVEVTIIDDAAAPVPTVSLSPVSQTVDEGSSATITATLSAVLTNNVTIPLTLSAGTAEAGDYGTLSSITIPSGSLSADGSITTTRDTDFDNETFTVSLGNLPSDVATGNPSSIIVTIRDLDTAPVSTISFTTATLSVAENGIAATLTATLSSALPNNVTIPLTITPSTTDPPESGDYTLSAQNITFGANTTSGSISILGNDDADYDDEVFTVAFGTLPAGVTAGSPASVVVTIEDDDTIPAISLEASPNPVEEGETVTIKATLSLAVTTALAIPLNVTPNSAETSDYTVPIPSEITIPAGSTTGEINILTHEDDFEYDDETFTVSLGNLPPEVVAGSPSSVVVTIDDDDILLLATVSLSATPNPAVEREIITVSADLSTSVSDPVIIPLVFTSGTAEDDDYNVVSPEIIIPAGSTTGTTTVFTYEDDNEDDNGTFTVSFGTLPSGIVAGNPSFIEITLVEDSSIPNSEISLSASPNPVDEGESVTVTAEIDVVPSLSVTIPLKITAGTAEPEDYGSLTESSITIHGGNITGTVDIETFHDIGDYDDETFTVAIDPDKLPLGLDLGNPSKIEITIADINPTISLEAEPNPVNEGDAVTISASLSEILLTNVVIPLVLSDVTTDIKDYQVPTPAQFTILAGETSGLYTISTVQDNIAEGNEVFSVAFGSLPDYLNAVNPSVEVTITDDDVGGINAPPSISISEGSTGFFDISLNSEPVDVITVTLTGYSGSDLTLTTSNTLTFDPGNWHESQQVILNAAEDPDFSDDQVELLLSATGGGYTGLTDRVQIMIIDNDRPGIDAPTHVTITEGNSETVNIVLTAAPADVVTMTISPVIEKITSSPTTLTFTPTNWESPQTVTLLAEEDDDFMDEREDIILTANGGGYVGVTRQVSVMILDDDEAGIEAVSTVTMNEGETYPLEVHLAAQPSGTVNLTLSGHTGTQLSLDRSSLTFTLNNWNISQTVMLTAEEDDDDFDLDHVTLLITASGGNYDNVTHQIDVAILENDDAISIYDRQESEEEDKIQLPVELNYPSDKVVTVEYVTTDVEAESSLDYTKSRGIVIFSPGATKAVITIDLIDDNILEEPERFEVVLSNPKNAVLARGVGTGTILDNDGGISLWVDDAMAMEEDGEVWFQVSLSHPQSQMITASYETRDGTAKAGEDYEASSGIVTLPPGVTEAIIVVPLLKNRFDWQEETFSLHLVSSDQVKILKSIGIATIQESTTATTEILEAYASRFLRTSATQIVEALGDRFRLREVTSNCGVASRAETAQLWHPTSSWDPSLGELLSGCKVATTSRDGSLSIWGQGAFRQFSGQETETLTLNGDVTTGMLGVDYRWEKGLLAGVLLSHSQGSGSFDTADQSGDIISGLTGIYPYLSYTRPGWDVWLSAGAGRGEAEVLELTDDLESWFGAMGIRGDLASFGIIGLNYHGDILMTDAESKNSDITVNVHRIRAGMEANARISDMVRPYVEANLRRDGGSAETGVGLEFGGGVRLSYPSWHLRGEIHTQGIVMHTADSFSEWGLSGMLQMGVETEGLMMRLRPSWGRRNGGVMYHQQTILNAVPLGANSRQTELELGYGIPWKKGTARSVMGWTQLPHGDMYRLGGELRPWEKFSVSIFGIAHARSLGGVGLNIKSSLQY